MTVPAGAPPIGRPASARGAVPLFAGLLTGPGAALWPAGATAAAADELVPPAPLSAAVTDAGDVTGCPPRPAARVCGAARLGRPSVVFAVVSLIVVIALGLLVTRVATVALTMTGMSLDHARFQARSAFTGTGFTTSEAEAVVNHPARRRVAMVLMLVSGAGAVSVLGTLILSFTGVDTTGRGFARAAVIVLLLAALLWLARNRVVDRALQRVIERFLRRYADLEVRDYAALLHLRGIWRVVQLPVEEDDWITSRPLGRLRLPEEGITVLGVERGTTWIGAPGDDLHVQPGDVVVLYGREEMLGDVAERLHGDEGEAAGERARAWHAATPPVEQLDRSWPRRDRAAS
ncbi:TrkA-C domain-containing protein [Geodermatophilus pulveris]|uniref:TrkA-C domain-containing protein n=1 Tax=Geodermatophilus pulveris TaxID=1564159 RepID=A0A239DN67_9ACTN|nr:TrkA C-terminal domain-containing protein [Geodermatophilus pulveris]SNS33599.1 TrkA-C domain-containing protein [Geodermatophilus pulveris]